MQSSRTLLLVLLVLIASSICFARVQTTNKNVAKSQRVVAAAAGENGLLWRRLQEDEGEDLHDDEEDDGEHHDDKEDDGEHHDDEEDGELHSHEELHAESDEILDDKPWGEVIVASLIINLVSLVGLVVVVAGVATRKWFGARNGGHDPNRFDWKFTHNMIPSFACGALIATCCFLIVPESVEMISSFSQGGEEGGHDEDGHRWLEEDEHDDHDDDTDAAVAWRFGACFVGGFLLPVVSSLVFPHYHEPELCDKCEADLKTEGGSKEEVEDLTKPSLSPPSSPANKDSEQTKGSVDGDCNSCSDNHDHEHEQSAHAHSHTHAHEHNDDLPGKQSLADETDVEEESANSIEPMSKPINYSLASSVLIGDFFHNFTDGVLLGTAFSLCHRELAIAVSVATIYHELAQEIADFFLLTKHCNLTIPVALTLNFIGGLSVMLGAILILTFEISANATGCILAIGAGVYIYIAAAECWPRAQAAQTTLTDKLLSLASFVVGVVPIGLVLLNHGHCEG